MYVLSGPHFNHLTRLAVPPTMTPAVDALFPVTALYDGRAASPARHGSAASSKIEVDLNMVAGGDAEAADSASKWTAVLGLGTLTRNASAPIYAGAASLKLTHTGPASWYQEMVVRPGEQLRFGGAALYGGGGAATAAISIRNLSSNRTLNSSGQWADTLEYVCAQNAASWAVFNPFTYTVEDFDACGGVFETRLAWNLNLAASGTVYFDAMYNWPLTNFAGVFGHNYAGHDPIELRSSTDNFSNTTVEATLLRKRPVTFARLAALNEARYWRLGTDSVPLNSNGAFYYGEVVLGQLVELLAPPAYPMRFERWHPQARSEMRQGGQRRYPDGAEPIRKGTLPFLLQDEASYLAVRRLLVDATRGGADPCVIVLGEEDAETCIFGRVEEKVSFAHTSFPTREVEISISEDPFPLLLL